MPNGEVVENGVRGVGVDARLQQIEPMAYRFLADFARDNELRVRHGRVAERTKCYLRALSA